MKAQELLDLSLSVLKDWRVITSAIVTIIFILMGNYVIKYRKKPPKVKRMKAPVPSPTPEKKDAS